MMPRFPHTRAVCVCLTIVLLVAAMAACSRPVSELPAAAVLPAATATSGVSAASPTVVRPTSPPTTLSKDQVLRDVHWLGHASFRLTGERVVYIDPWQLKGEGKADIILVTHAHADHCSPADVAKIRGPETVVLAPADCVARLGGEVRVVKPGDRLTVQGVAIEVVPAYNIAKSNHPKQSGWVGYIVTLNGVRIYHAGDTERIPEMEGLKADVALLPVDGKYTMTAAEAAGAADAITPQVAVPIHWGTSVGSRADAEQFQDKCKVPVQIMQVES